jgi:hypothetical protein
MCGSTLEEVGFEYQSRTILGESGSPEQGGKDMGGASSGDYAISNEIIAIFEGGITDKEFTLN